VPRIEVAGEISLRRPRPTQGWRAEEEEQEQEQEEEEEEQEEDDDNDDDGCLFFIIELNGQILTPVYKDSLLNTARLLVEFFQLCFYDSYDNLESVHPDTHEYTVSSHKG
jgi:hypothetical protein